MDLNTYQLAKLGTVYRWVPDPGYLLITGEDQLSFLQRQTTNDLRLVLPARAVLTILTSATARILDALTVFPAQGQAEPMLALLTLPGRQSHTVQFLRSRVFFMDRVEIQDISQQYIQVDLLGPAAGSVLGSLGLPSPSAQDDWSMGAFQGASVQLFGQGVTLGLGCRLVIPSTLLQPLVNALHQNGAQQCDEETYQVLRVEAGLPGTGAELSEDYNPLEVGLASRISANKGCYTGQEIIARQMNYDKVTRSLVGLRLESPAAPGSALKADGKPAGEVTSAVVSPRLGPIALGVVRRPHHEPGGTLTLEIAGTPVQATVSPLPFNL